MKTAGRETPKRYATVGSVPSSRNGRQEPSCSTRWAGRQENSRPRENIFFLTPFIELHRSLLPQFKRLPLQPEPVRCFFSFVLMFSVVYPLPVMRVYFIGAFVLAAAGIGLWRLSRGRGRALKALIRIGALGMVLASALSLLGFLFTGAMCGRYDFPSAHAPNGFWVAAVSEQDCGALDSFHSSVQIWSRRHTLLNPFGSRMLASTIFTIGHDPRLLKLEWNGPSVLVIRYPNDSATPNEFLCRSRWKDVQIECISYTPDYRKSVGNMPNPKRWFY